MSTTPETRIIPARTAAAGHGTVVAWGGALFTLLLHFLTNGGYHVFRDEFYYLACGRHLAWGYVDHPPLVAVLARFSELAFGHSMFGIRLLPAVAGAMLVFFTALMARELGGGRWAQALAALCAIVAPVYLEGFTIFTMNAFDFLFWTVLAYLLIRILRGADPKLWLLFGVVAGVGLLNKHSVLFLLGGVFLGLLLTPARRHLARPWVWLGALIAGAIFLPHVVWQIHHGWPTREFMANARAEKNAPVTPLGFFLGQVLIHNPATAPVWLSGLGFLLAARSMRALRTLGIAYLAIFMLFVITQAKLYYLSPAYPMLFAAGGVAFERLAARVRAFGWLPSLYATVLVVAGAILAPVVLPILPPERLEAYIHAIHLKPPMMERHRVPRLTQTFADEFGWEEMVQKVAAIYNSLPPEERFRCAIYCHNYGEAGAIDFYGPRYGLPHAVSGHNNYFLWGPPAGRGLVIITVGESREDVSKTYNEVIEMDRTDSPFAMPFENEVPIFVGRGPKNTLQEIWWRCKDYI